MVRALQTLTAFSASIFEVNRVSKLCFDRQWLREWENILMFKASPLPLSKRNEKGRIEGET